MLAHFVTPPPDNLGHIAAIGGGGGSVSLLLTWLAQRMDAINLFLGMLSRALGVAIGFVTLVILCIKLEAWLRWRRTHRNPPPSDPADVDDVPM